MALVDIEKCALCLKLYSHNKYASWVVTSYKGPSPHQVFLKSRSNIPFEADELPFLEEL